MKEIGWRNDFVHLDSNQYSFQTQLSAPFFVRINQIKFWWLIKLLSPSWVVGVIVSFVKCHSVHITASSCFPLAAHKVSLMATRPTLELVIIFRFFSRSDILALQTLNGGHQRCWGWKLMDKISMSNARQPCYYDDAVVLRPSSSWFYELRGYSLLLSIYRPLWGFIECKRVVERHREHDTMTAILLNRVTQPSA